MHAVLVLSSGRFQLYSIKYARQDTNWNGTGSKSSPDVVWLRGVQHIEFNTREEAAIMNDCPVDALNCLHCYRSLPCNQRASFL